MELKQPEANRLLMTVFREDIRSISSLVMISPILLPLPVPLLTKCSIKNSHSKYKQQAQEQISQTAANTTSAKTSIPVLSNSSYNSGGGKSNHLVILCMFPNFYYAMLPTRHLC